MTDTRAWSDHKTIEAHKLSPSIVKEREWARPDENHWRAFFNGTRALFHDRERCDCSASTSGADVTPLGAPTRKLGAQCGRRQERRYYKSEDGRIQVSYVVSDCGGTCSGWVHRCAACWRDAKLGTGNHAAVLLNQGLQSGWFHPESCYTQLAEAAGTYLREGGVGLWLSTNWPERAWMFGRVGGFKVRGYHENRAAMHAVENATTAGGRYAWGSLDVGLLDRRLRVLEASVQSRAPLRWDPFHYEPFFYEVLGTLLLGKLCGPQVLEWDCSS